MAIWVERLKLISASILMMGLALSLSISSSVFAQNSANDELENEGEQPQSVCPAGIIQVAELDWDAAKILAHMHVEILSHAFNCNVQLFPVDMSRAMAQFSRAREPLIVPELWLSRVAPIWNDLADQELVQSMSATYSSSQLQGWYVPDYALPNSAASIAAFKSAVDDGLIGSDGKIDFISCPNGWACQLINRNMFEAFGLSDQFELVEPESLGDMNAKIALTISKQEPALFYYWTPSSLLAQFDFKRLAGANYSAEGYACNASQECTTPSKTDFGPEQVVVAVSKDLIDNHSEIADYLSKATIDLDDMSEMLSLKILADREPKNLAVELLKKSDDWQAWLGEERSNLMKNYLSSLGE